MTNYIFSIKLSRALSVFFLLLGGIFFAAGVDMVFLHKFIPGAGESGFAFASWFCLIVGGLVGFTGIQNCLSPMTLIAVNKQGVALKSAPGPTRKLTLVPWQDIAGIGQGEIVMSGSKGGKVRHSTIKFILKQGSPSAKSRFTDGMVRWSNEEINFDSIYFKVDLQVLINILQAIKANPNEFDELNVDIDYFLKHNKIG